MNRGYSVIEVIVALTLFVTVVAISSSTTLAILNGNRSLVQSQNLFSNVEVALDDMVRNLRSGSVYHCQNNNGNNGNLNLGKWKTCSGGNLLAFESFGGDLNKDDDQIVYRYTNNVLYQSSDGGNTLIPVFDNSIKVLDFRVWVEGSNPNDQIQPRAQILIVAEIRDNNKGLTSTARYQMSVVQRVLDIDKT